MMNLEFVVMLRCEGIFVTLIAPVLLNILDDGAFWVNFASVLSVACKLQIAQPRRHRWNSN